MNAVDTAITREQLKPLLAAMLEAEALHEESWDPAQERYLRSREDCHTQAAGGDEVVGYLLYLFHYWENDVEEIARREFGLAPRVVVVVLPADTPSVES